MLTPVCWKLCRDCSTTPKINRVQSFFQLNTWGTDNLRNSSSTPPNDYHFSFPIIERTFYFIHRRKLDCSGCCCRSGTKWQRACHLLRFQGFLESPNHIFCNQAVVFGNFRHYLLGRKFTIVTGHRALQWLHNAKVSDGLTARWLEKLAAFDYEVRHKPGSQLDMPMVCPAFLKLKCR